MNTIKTAHRSDTVRKQEPNKQVLHQLEATDPEGHGPNIKITPVRVLLMLAGVGLVAAVSATVAWSIFGTDIAMIVLVTFLITLLLSSVTIGGVMLLRSKEHTRLERKARLLQAWTARRSGRGGWVSSPPEKTMPPEVESQQRLDDDGSPTSDLVRPT